MKNSISIHTKDYAQIFITSEAPLVLNFTKSDELRIIGVSNYFEETTLNVFEHDIINNCNDKKYTLSMFFIPISDIDYFEVDSSLTERSADNA